MWNSSDWEAQADGLKNDLTSLRRYFHQNPELSEMEFSTQAKICELLEKENIPYVKMAGTGVMATVTADKPGKVIGYRADIDALPIQEMSKVDYASINSGVMHACGHDAHISIAFYTAKVLNDNKDKWNGAVKFFFQPAEETIGGADRMVKEGCMKNPVVDYCIALHVMPNLDTGKIQLKYGTLNATTDSFQLTVKGKSGHGAVPDKCIDSIVISAKIISAFETIISRSISPLDPAVLTIGKINGGVAGNVIASEVEMHGTMRTANEKMRKILQKKVRITAEGVAATMEGSAEVVFEFGYPAVINDERMVTVLRGELVNYFGENNVLMREKMSMGGEDFSFFSEHCPSMFYFLGGKIASRENYLLHTSDFDIDEDCMPVGVKANMAIIMRLLEGNIYSYN